MALECQVNKGPGVRGANGFCLPKGACCYSDHWQNDPSGCPFDPGKDTT